MGDTGKQGVGKPLMLLHGHRIMGVDSRTLDGDTVVVTKSDDWFVAKDGTSGIASQGKTKADALRIWQKLLS